MPQALCSAGDTQNHGLFVPNLSFPKGRHLLISRYDEEISIDNRAYCWRRRVADGQYHAMRSIICKSSCWTTHCDLDLYFGAAALERSIVMPHQNNTVCVRYRLCTDASLRMKLHRFLRFAGTMHLTRQLRRIHRFDQHRSSKRKLRNVLYCCVSPCPAEAVFVAEKSRT